MVEELIGKYGDEYVTYVLPKLPVSDYGNLESMVLYCFIRDTKPENVAEIGTEHKSRSSYIIESALERNGLPHLHIMADLTGVVETARQNLSMDFNTDIKVLSGIIQQTYTQQKWDEVDFLFIDADHVRDFAEWYFEHIFPHICEGVPVHVHDLDLYADWKWEVTLNSEAEEFIERHNEDKLGLEKLFWLYDYFNNPEYYPLLAKIRERYPFVGEQNKPLPYKSNASYWRKS